MVIKPNTFFIPVIVIVVFDQILKALIVKSSASLPLAIIPSILRLNYVTNTGLAFGKFTGNNLLLAAISIGVAALIITLKDEFKPGTEILAARFILGGTLGNLIDRIFHGAVIDFIQIPGFPVFNLADSSLTIGAVLILTAYVREKFKSRKKHLVHKPR